jgi:hypothetical protein
MSDPESPRIPASSEPDAPPKRQRSFRIRFISAVAGVLVLLVSALFSLGASLVAPLGVLAARIVARRRGRPVTRRGTWLGAVVASSVGFALVLGVLMARSPTNPFQAILTPAAGGDTQSAAAPPTWFTRVFPQQRTSPFTEYVTKSRPFRIYFGLVGVALVCLVAGGVAGTAGWLGTNLCGYAFRRRRAA